MTDDDIDYSDIPPLNETFFERAQRRLPKQQVAVTIHVDPEVLAWFHAQGDEWEKRMRAALRIYVEAHQEHPSARAV